MPQAVGSEPASKDDRDPEMPCNDTLCDDMLEPGLRPGTADWQSNWVRGTLLRLKTQKKKQKKPLESQSATS